MARADLAQLNNYVTRTFVSEGRPPAEPGAVESLGAELTAWIVRARRAGLDDGAIRALVSRAA